jgi:hypothetical protein
MVLCFLSVGFSGLMLWWRLEKEIGCGAPQIFSFANEHGPLTTE